MASSLRGPGLGRPSGRKLVPPLRPAALTTARSAPLLLYLLLSQVFGAALGTAGGDENTNNDFGPSRQINFF